MSKKGREAKKRDRAKREQAKRTRRLEARAQEHFGFSILMFALTKGEVCLEKSLEHYAYLLRKQPTVIEADERCLDLPGYQIALDDLRAAVAAATVELLPHRIIIPLDLFRSRFEPIAELAAMNLSLPKETRDAQLILAKHVLPFAEENRWRAAAAMCQCLNRLVLRWRMDRAYYYADLQKGQEGILKLSVRDPPAPISFVHDGEKRPAWRCGHPAVVGDVFEWTSWSADVRGAPQGSPTADVFVQSHALKKLRERVPVALVDTGALESWAIDSLMRPVLIPRGPKNWLVEFRIRDVRLGYFTAVEIDGRILLTTFLFLTMRDTPEGKLIRERLGLRADEIEWLRADSLPFFTQSDVAQDGELRAILTECGCGHLFDLIEPEAREITFRGAARDLRRHLGMPIPPHLLGFSSSG